MKFSQERKSLLSSQARIQIPWIKVSIGAYTFGVFNRTTREKAKDGNGFYTPYGIQFPNYIQSLDIIKINGQVNQYTLNIIYPITQFDDPNFFEKVFSSVSNTRKIVFSYGDVSQPAYIYKDEEAVITKVTSTFDLQGSKITYVVNAVSGAALHTDGCLTFISDGKPHKPSDKIKQLFKTNKSLQNTFTGMNIAKLEEYIAGDDAEVVLNSKQNISALDYIKYLVSCMRPSGTSAAIAKDIYILTVHDDTVYDQLADHEATGPYFQVKKTSYVTEQSDAYEVDIGFNSAAIVNSFNIEQNENYALYYEYQQELHPKEYVRRINADGLWEDVYAPTVTAKNEFNQTFASDQTWWTKITQYPISATIQIQGLLRPATLMQYLRLNVVFPGGHKHISSGLYIVTKQQDRIDSNGYKTTLSLTKISGDKSEQVNPYNL